MGRPRAPGIPGWLAFASRYGPLVLERHGTIAECDWLHEDAREPDKLDAMARDGWVDVWPQRGRARLYLAVARFCDVLVDGGDFVEQPDLRDALNDVWVACGEWLDLRRNPWRPGTWPAWLSRLDVGECTMRAPRGGPPRTRFYAFKPDVRTDVGVAERALAWIAAGLLHDASVLTAPAVRFVSLARCQACASFFIRSYVHSEAAASSGSPHTYCAKRCGRATRRAQQAAMARAHEAKAAAERQAEWDARTS